MNTTWISGRTRVPTWAIAQCFWYRNRFLLWVCYLEYYNIRHNHYIIFEVVIHLNIPLGLVILLSTWGH